MNRKRLARESPVKSRRSFAFVFHHAARVHRAIRAESLAAHVDMSDDPLLVDDEGRSVGKILLRVQHAVILGNFAVKIAEQRKRDSDLLGKSVIGRRTVHADAQNLCPRFFEFGHISLIGLQLLRSTACECQNVKGQHDVVFAQKA
jgi:hypothetical protein